MIEQSVLDYYMESSADDIFCISQLHYHFKKCFLKEKAAYQG